MSSFSIFLMNIKKFFIQFKILKILNSRETLRESCKLVIKKVWRAWQVIDDCILSSGLRGGNKQDIANNTLNTRSLPWLLVEDDDLYLFNKVTIITSVGCNYINLGAATTTTSDTHTTGSNHSSACTILRLQQGGRIHLAIRLKGCPAKTN